MSIKPYFRELENGDGCSSKVFPLFLPYIDLITLYASQIDGTAWIFTVIPLFFFPVTSHLFQGLLQPRVYAAGVTKRIGALKIFGPVWV